MSKLYLVIDGEQRTPKLGWSWFADQIVADDAHTFADTRWCYALTEEGYIVKVYDGRGMTLLRGSGCGPTILKGRRASRFIREVNERIGVSDSLVREIIEIF
jgi:hypothetical protein